MNITLVTILLFFCTHIQYQGLNLLSPLCPIKLYNFTNFTVSQVSQWLLSNFIWVKHLIMAFSVLLRILIFKIILLEIERSRTFIIYIYVFKKQCQTFYIPCVDWFPKIDIQRTINWVSQDKRNLFSHNSGG